MLNSNNLLLYFNLLIAIVYDLELFFCTLRIAVLITPNLMAYICYLHEALPVEYTFQRHISFLPLAFLVTILY